RPGRETREPGPIIPGRRVRHTHRPVFRNGSIRIERTWRIILATEIVRALHHPITLSGNRGRREDRVAAAPGALAQKKLRKRESTGTAVITPAFPARWFTAYRRSPR